MALLETSIRGAFNAYNRFGFHRNFMGRIIRLGRQEFSDQILGNYSAYITSFTDPGATRTILDTTYLGKRFVYPSILEYENIDAWTVTFKMNECMGLKTCFEQELLRQSDPSTCRSLLPCASEDEIIIAILDETGKICRAKKLLGAFLIGIDSTEFNMEDTEIQTMTATFGYQIWEPYAISDATGIADFDVSAGDAFPGDGDDGDGPSNRTNTLQDRYDTFKAIIDERAREREDCKINF